MSSHELTPRQAEALDMIIAYREKEGRSPSFRDIADGLGLKSVHPAYRLCVELYEKGYVTWRSKGRSIRILKRGKARQTS